MHQTLEKSMFSLLFKKNYSISILHGSESLPVVVITIHPPKGRQATPKGQPKDGEVNFPTSLACRGVQRRSLWQGQLITDQRWQPTCCQSLYGSPGASWQDKQAEGEAVPDVSIWYILFTRFSVATQCQGCQTGD